MRGEEKGEGEGGAGEGKRVEGRTNLILLDPLSGSCSSLQRRIHIHTDCNARTRSMCVKVSILFINVILNL